MSSLPATQTAPLAESKNPLAVMLNSALPRITDALGSVALARRMVQVMLAMHFEDSKLRQCDRGTILACVLKAASFGFELEKSMQEAFLIPRWNKKAGPTDANGKPMGAYECTLMIGYQGIRKLAMESDKVGLIETFAVHENDYLEYERSNAGIHFLHRPKLFTDRGPAIGFVSCAQMTNGMISYEFMSIEQVDHVMHKSETFKWLKPDEKPSGPWITDYDEMARKTILKRHCKSLPRSLKLANAIDEDNDEYKEKPQEPKQLGNEAFKSRLMAPKTAEPAVDPMEKPTSPHTGINPEVDDSPLTEKELEEMAGADLANE